MDKQHRADSSTQSSSLPCTPSTSFCPSHTPDNILLSMHFLLKHNDHRYQKYFSPQRPQKLLLKNHTVSVDLLLVAMAQTDPGRRNSCTTELLSSSSLSSLSALSSLISIAIAERKVLPFNFPTFTEYVVNKEHNP